MRFKQIVEELTWLFAWWVSPSGVIYKLTDGDHIDFILSNQKLFGVNRNDFSGDEDGDYDMLSKVVEKGWLKIHFSNSLHAKRVIHVMVGHWNNKTKSNFWSFINKEFPNHSGIEISIFPIYNERDIKGSIEQFKNFSSEVYEQTLIPVGGIGITREEMPQIPAAKLDEFFLMLQEIGIDVRKDVILHSSELKPTQSHIDLDKVSDSRSNYDKPLVISNDFYILDGHHGWASQFDRNIKCVVVDLPIGRLIELSNVYIGNTGDN